MNNENKITYTIEFRLKRRGTKKWTVRQIADTQGEAFFKRGCGITEYPRYNFRVVEITHIEKRRVLTAPRKTEK